MKKNDDILTQPEKRKTYVRHMFNDIAHRYDFLNHFLSGGIDIYWRRKAVALLDLTEHAKVLDLACGTGDFGFESIHQKKCKVIGLDFALNMLHLAKDKHSRLKKDGSIYFCNGDGEYLPFPQGTFDAVIIAFGIRNMGSIEQALDEMYRILKPTGQAIILEFSVPGHKIFRSLYLFYFQHILPTIGRIFSGSKDAYAYLPASVDHFPEIDLFIETLKNAGFVNENHYKLLDGVAVIYKAHKQ